jgi:hypothetical protein
MENKAWIIILSILLGLSIFLNITLFYTISYIDMEWENDYNTMFVEYCEFTNDHGDLINDLIAELQTHDSYYDDVELYEKADCFS